MTFRPLRYVQPHLVIYDHALPRDFNPPEPAHRTHEQVRKRYGFSSDLQIAHAIDHLKFPKGAVQITTRRTLPASAERTWSQRELGEFDEHLSYCFPPLAAKQ